MNNKEVSMCLKANSQFSYVSGCLFIYCLIVVNIVILIYRTTRNTRGFRPIYHCAQEKVKRNSLKQKKVNYIENNVEY